MNTIYLDNSATTALCDEAKQAMLAAMECYGNPSSLHKAGLDAEHMVKKAREQVLSALGVRTNAGQVYFTSSGTEANNLAILGSAYAKERRAGGRIVTTEGEHSSVEMVLRDLEKKGFDVVRIPTRDGVLDMDFASKAITKDTLLVTTMMVNNETGALYDIKQIKRIIDISGCGAHLHLDAVQGFMKVSGTSVYRLCDSIAVSAHKIGGFKGTGALIVRKNARVKPLILGGSQEKGFRSGTENLNGIISFAESIKAWDGKDLPNIYEKTLSALREVPYLELNIPENHCNHIISCVSRGIRSETLINYLSSLGVYLSASSACSSKAKGNPVLEAYGLTPEETISALRISISPKTTDTEIARLKEAFLLAGERFLK